MGAANAFFACLGESPMQHLPFLDQVGMTPAGSAAAAGQPAWWAPFYVDGSQKARDRTMFSS